MKTDLESAIANLVSERRGALHLAATLVAGIRVNALRGTFRHATYEQVDEWLGPFVQRLRALQGDEPLPKYDPDPPPGPKVCPIHHNDENRHFRHDDYCTLCEQPWTPS